jgi:hypothetical protein
MRADHTGGNEVPGAGAQPRSSNTATMFVEAVYSSLRT